MNKNYACVCFQNHYFPFFPFFLININININVYCIAFLVYSFCEEKARSDSDEGLSLSTHTQQAELLSFSSISEYYTLHLLYTRNTTHYIYYTLGGEQNG